MNKQGILIFVDDDPLVLEALEIELESVFGDDYQFETAMDAAEALSLIRSLAKKGSSVFLIISDWLMPGMKGDDFLIEVYKEWPKIKTIMLTGQANEESIQRAIKESSMEICIRKPWIKNELIDAISVTLKDPDD